MSSVGGRRDWGRDVVGLSERQQGEESNDVLCFHFV